MTEKRQTSQGYIIRILQHFAMKLWNITNFVMLFQAVMKFLSKLMQMVHCKFHSMDFIFFPVFVHANVKPYFQYEVQIHS